MMSYKRGAVVLVLFPNSDLQTAKRRPALVVQSDALATGLPQIILALISSNLARAGHPSRIPISIATPDGQMTGLKTDSIVMTDNLVTVQQTEIERVLGKWPNMIAVDAALRHTLGL